MRMKFFKNKKFLLVILSVLIIGGVGFAIIQVVNALPGTATTGSTPIPGHSWSQMANFSCPSGECLQSNSSGVLTCASCGGHWTQSGTALFPYLTTWNVGIGTTNPQAKLDVNGVIKARTSLDLTGASGGILDYYGSSGTSGQILYRQTNGVTWGNAGLTCTTVTSNIGYGNGWHSGSASCSGGYTLTGGGFRCDDAGIISDVIRNYPSGNTWYCYVHQDYSVSNYCYARCCQ